MVKLGSKRLYPLSCRAALHVLPLKTALLGMHGIVLNQKSFFFFKRQGLVLEPRLAFGLSSISQVLRF